MNGLFGAAMRVVCETQPLLWKEKLAARATCVDGWRALPIGDAHTCRVVEVLEKGTKQEYLNSWGQHIANCIYLMKPGDTEAQHIMKRVGSQNFVVGPKREFLEDPRVWLVQLFSEGWRVCGWSKMYDMHLLEVPIGNSLHLLPHWSLNGFKIDYLWEERALQTGVFPTQWHSSRYSYQCQCLFCKN